MGQCSILFDFFFYCMIFYNLKKSSNAGFLYDRTSLGASKFQRPSNCQMLSLDLRSKESFARTALHAYNPELGMHLLDHRTVTGRVNPDDCLHQSCIENILNI